MTRLGVVCAGALVVTLAGAGAAASASSSLAARGSHGPTARQSHTMRHGGTLAFEVFDPVADDDSIWLVNGDGTGLRQLTGNGFQQAHWSPDGSTLAAAGNLDQRIETWLVDPDTGDASELPMPDPVLDSRCFTWSPRGDRLGCEIFDPAAAMGGGFGSARASDGADLTTIVHSDDLVDGDFGGFAPDGRSIVYMAGFDDTDLGLYTARTDGSHQRRLTPRRLLVRSGGDYSPNGRLIVFSAQASPDVRQSLWVVRTGGTHVHRLHVREHGSPCGGPFSQADSVGCSDPSWSPDGRLIAYRHNTTPATELHVARRDGSVVRSLTTSVDHSFDVEAIDWGWFHPAA